MGQVTLPLVLQTTEMLMDDHQLKAYGALTRDTNPIHLDAKFAATTPYGKCIAHGTLTLNALWRSIDKTFRAVDGTLPPLTLDIKFSAPVFVGAALTGGGARIEEQPNRYDVWVRAGERVVISGQLTVD